MYLSRLILNLRSSQVRRDIAKPYEMHRTISRAFPDRAEGGYGRLLWRLDKDRRSNVHMIIVQSEVKPDWSRVLQSCADYLDDMAMENPATKEVPDEQFRFKPGSVLSFRLRANPTQKTGTTSKSERLDGKAKNNGKRIAIIDEQGQLDWLKRKGQAGGFQVASVNLHQEDSPNDMVKGQKVVANTRHSISMLAVRFDGMLQVTDTDKFAQTIKKGIGSGKGLGFGLLSLARS